MAALNFVVFRTIMRSPGQTFAEVPHAVGSRYSFSLTYPILVPRLTAVVYKYLLRILICFDASINTLRRLQPYDSLPDMPATRRRESWGDLSRLLSNRSLPPCPSRSHEEAAEDWHVHLGRAYGLAKGKDGKPKGKLAYYRAGSFSGGWESGLAQLAVASTVAIAFGSNGGNAN